MQRHSALRLAILAALSLCHPAHAQDINEQGVEELRNTLVSVMEALVQKGVLTREQAQQIVANAQAKTEAAAKEKAKQEAAEKDAVRVTYVPENIKKEIGEQVAAQLKPDVVHEVVAQAKNEKWGVPGALPDWINNLKVYGDVRIRAEQDAFGSDNGRQFDPVTGNYVDVRGFYLNYDAINNAGSKSKAGVDALLNVTEDRFRAQARMRLGLMADLGGSFKADVRMSSGTGRNVGSTIQTLGNYDARGSVNVDKAALIWDHFSPGATSEFEVRAGRFANPYNATSELVWDTDLTLEGLSTTYALDLFGRQPNQMERGLYLTLGAMPLQEIERSNKDKWLLGAQLGSELPFGESSLFKLSGAYYDYTHMLGVVNDPNSHLTDFTAARYLQKGNHVFNISTDSNSDQYGLASEFRLIDANLAFDFPFVAGKRMTLSAEYVRNLAFDAAKVMARLGSSEPGVLFEAGGKGYDVGLTVGDTSLSSLGNWRAGLSYRYLENDAVLDAFTDSDFHLGGTGAKGYTVSFDLGLSRNTWLKARLMSASEIGNSLPYAIDVYQFDFNGSF